MYYSERLVEFQNTEVMSYALETCTVPLAMHIETLKIGKHYPHQRKQEKINYHTTIMTIYFIFTFKNTHFV